MGVLVGLRGKGGGGLILDGELDGGLVGWT